MPPKNVGKTPMGPGADQDKEFGEDRAAFLPQWWNEHPGETFIGTVKDSERVEGVVSQLTGEIRDLDLYTVVTDDGEVYTMWGSGMLGRLLPRHMGHRVRIEDKGLEQQADKTQLRIFDFRCATCTADGR